MIVATRFGGGAVRHVGPLLDEYCVASIFLVSGSASFRLCGAEETLRRPFEGRQVVRFDDFGPSFQLTDVGRALRMFEGFEPDLVLAVGGGSVIDMAKLVGVLSAQTGDGLKFVGDSAKLRPATVPLIAVPTTAGTGSEATHFATVFDGERKLSVAHPSMLPTASVVDPELCSSMPPKLTAISGMDALSQGVESMWSVNSTQRSRQFAKETIRLVLASLEKAVHNPSAEVRTSMARAAHLSGMAINISKTTAPHALSYAMTSRFEVPHGLAVALTLGPMLVYNSKVTQGDILDRRGVEHVQRIVLELNELFGATEAEHTCNKLSALMKRLGLPTRLAEVGIQADSERRWLAESVNKERLANNPRAIDGAGLLRVLEQSS